MTTCQRYIRDKNRLREQAENGSPLYVKRALYAKYPGIDSELIRFVRFAGRLRLPVTRRLMQKEQKLLQELFELQTFLQAMDTSRSS